MSKKKKIEEWELFYDPSGNYGEKDILDVIEKPNEEEINKLSNIQATAKKKKKYKQSEYGELYKTVGFKNLNKTACSVKFIVKNGKEKCEKMIGEINTYVPKSKKSKGIFRNKMISNLRKGEVLRAINEFKRNKLTETLKVHNNLCEKNNLTNWYPCKYLIRK
jgi:hypothetical protein